MFLPHAHSSLHSYYDVSIELYLLTVKSESLNTMDFCLSNVILHYALLQRCNVLCVAHTVTLSVS